MAPERVPRIHAHLVDSVGAALREIFFGANPRYAERVVETWLLRQKKWGARDRRFFAESVYECTRWWRRLWFCLQQAPVEQDLLLRQVWALWWWSSKQRWPEDIFPTTPQVRKAQELWLKLQIRTVQQSVPDWLDERGVLELPQKWEILLNALNERAPVDLRVNTLLATRAQVQHALSQEGIATQILPGSVGLTLVERRNVFVTAPFQQGWFEVQDRGSQKISPLLPVRPGDRVIDACAGAGGKTLQLAAMMENKGKIIAMDLHGGKLDELRKRAARARVNVIETRVIESSKTIKRLEESADHVLLDVPCSGLGVLRRHPDTKWKLTRQDLDELVLRQAEILRSYSRMVKPGGYLVYATCSILPSENEHQVRDFLGHSAGQEWELRESQRWDPAAQAGDGFYAALLQKRTSQL